MQKRVALWDNLKLFLIFLVVIGHLTIQYFSSSQMFCAMTLAIYTFHMPAFIFVSGLFAKKAINSSTPPYKRVFGFLMIYLGLRVVNYASNIVFGVKCSFDIFSVKDIPWYMLSMAIWYMITYVLKSISPKYIFTTSVIFACFAGYMTGDADFLCILRVVTFYPFFYAGYVLDRGKIEEITAKKGARIFSGIAFSTFVVICATLTDKIKWLFPLLSGRRKYGALGDFQPWGCLMRLAYFAIALMLVFAVISLCPRKETPFSRQGRNTLQIYFWHRPILYIMKNAGLFYLIKQIGAGWEWVALIVIIALTAVLNLSFLGKPLELLMNPKEKKEYAITE